MASRRDDIDHSTVVEMYDKDLKTTKEISLYFKCSQWKIQQILKEQNVKAIRGKKFRNMCDNDIVKLYNDGYSTSHIGNMYGCCGDYIRKKLNKCGVDTSTSVFIDECEFRDVLFNKHFSCKEMCRHFRCSYTTINRCFKRFGINRMPFKFEVDINRGHKLCTKCKSNKPVNCFSSRRKSLNSWCISCCKKERKKWGEKNRSKNKNNNNIREITKNKKCLKCRKIKLSKYFHLLAVSVDGLANICKKCSKENFSNYCKNNKNKIFEIRNRRRERNFGVNNRYSKNHREITLIIFDKKCFNCGSTKKLTIDHHLPLAKKNPLTIKNAVVLCKSCNSSKKDKLPREFYSSEKLLDVDNKLKLAQYLYRVRYGI